MARKMPALQGPLKSWVGKSSWMFLRTWGDEHKLTHPFAIAVKLNERGEEARECQVLMRNHTRKIGAWHLVRAEKIHKLRPVWVAGFRRCPLDYEIKQQCLLDADQVKEYVHG